MLARPHRLVRGSDYRTVVRRGRRYGGPRLIISVLDTGERQPVRFGFIVSKQVGSAVTRNTVRRRLKAVCAEALPSVAPGTDVVIRALPSAAVADFAALRAEVVRCLNRRAAA